MKRDVMKKWVKALRSGKYLQGKWQLMKRDKVTGHPTYCCLGVLADIVCDERALSKSDELGIHSLLTDRVKQLAGMKTNDGAIKFKEEAVLSLPLLNDTRKRSFKQIAAFIERNWKRL